MWAVAGSFWCLSDVMKSGRILFVKSSLVAHLIQHSIEAVIPELGGGNR